MQLSRPFRSVGIVRRIRIVRSVLLVGILAALTFGSAQAATEYLIVTTDELAPAFQGLADQRALGGLATEVVTVESIVAQGVAGRDVPERIRSYIQSIYAQGSLRFVVLGGDTDQVPARFVHDELYPMWGTEIPTDLYFAALDGDWDADGDGVFGEFDVDAADMDPELAVGRVPARSAAEAGQYVAKVIEYENPAHRAHLDAALYLGEVLAPDPWNPGDPVGADGAALDEELRTIVEGGDGPTQSGRLYENSQAFPGSTTLSRSQALAAMDSGDYGLILHVGHGNAGAMSVGDGLIESADASGLANGPDLFVVMTMAPNGAAFDGAAILEEFLRNPDGGAVAALGYTRASFVSSAQAQFEAVQTALFLDGAASVGEALQAVQTSRAVAAETESFQRYAQIGFQLLGDPASEVGPGVATVAPPSARATRLLVEDPVPNPFNPRVTIRFELFGASGARLPLRVEVFGVSGRHVRTLRDEIIEVGPHTVTWDGRGDEGARMPSGVYFLRVRAGGESQAVKLVLTK
jgi:hypothetical protein